MDQNLPRADQPAVNGTIAWQHRVKPTVFGSPNSGQVLLTLTHPSGLGVHLEPADARRLASQLDAAADEAEAGDA